MKRANPVAVCLTESVMKLIGNSRILLGSLDLSLNRLGSFGFAAKEKAKIFDYTLQIQGALSRRSFKWPNFNSKFCIEFLISSFIILPALINIHLPVHPPIHDLSSLRSKENLQPWCILWLWLGAIKHYQLSDLLFFSHFLPPVVPVSSLFPLQFPPFLSVCLFIAAGS